MKITHNTFSVEMTEPDDRLVVRFSNQNLIIERNKRGSPVITQYNMGNDKLPRIYIASLKHGLQEFHP